MAPITTNPFQYDEPTTPEQFIPPNAELLNTIMERIANRGNTVIVSEPKCGKSSLLLYLKSPSVARKINAERKRTHFFQYLDVNKYAEKTLTKIMFWRHALSPVKIVAGRFPNGDIDKAYKSCEEDGFDYTSVQELIARIHTHNARLVLMIDNFEDLLLHPELGGSEFFGRLRLLVTQMESFVLLITSRLTISELNGKLQSQHNSASPYLNPFIQQLIGPFSESSAQQLLKRGDQKFCSQDNIVLMNITGGHPYFLQVAAHVLWDAYEKNLDPTARLENIVNQLHLAAESVLQNTWFTWNPAIRKTIIVIALAQIPRILGKQEFDISLLRQSLPRYSSELQRLESSGFITSTSNRQVKWEISSPIVLEWLKDFLLAASKDTQHLAQFLQRHELSNLFTSAEKTEFYKAVGELNGLIKNGANTFIKSAAAGIAQNHTSKL